jgi:hypothetical protein
VKSAAGNTLFTPASSFIPGEPLGHGDDSHSLDKTQVWSYRENTIRYMPLFPRTFTATNRPEPV